MQVTPDPESTIESPHHIAIIASGTVINSEKMRNMNISAIVSKYYSSTHTGSEGQEGDFKRR